MIRVVADENIPAISRALPGDVDLHLMPGRRITPQALSEADALFIRSVTPVNAALLRRSRVRFVGSATAGLDHVDTGWLEQSDIPFAGAPGSNAESVAEYIAAALLHLASRRGEALAGKTIGIVGVGQCGSRVERVARALGMEPLLCDPPLARTGDDERFVGLEALIEADFVTLHVPLTREGPDATRGMISRTFIDGMRPSAVLINASRGDVVDESALIDALEEGRLGGAVLDAWVGEPRINRRLLELVSIGTPHIAGYSTDGKIRGTAMIAAAFARAFDLEMTWRPEDELPPRVGEIDLRRKKRSEAVAAAVRKAYPITRDGDGLNESLNMTADEAAAHFDRLRKEYPVRREFSAYAVRISPENASLAGALSGLGFSRAAKGTGSSG